LSKTGRRRFLRGNRTSRSQNESWPIATGRELGELMGMISYAQNGEDVVLARAFPRGHNGFYVDVGASDPVVDSVTKHFYDLGWSGINVEPATLALEALRQSRPRDLNLGCGVGAEPGEVTFYELPRQMTGCSSFSRELADEYHGQGWRSQARTAPVTTLAELCEVHAADQLIDFLKIDVEGDEAAVLQGADFDRFRPRVLIVEATLPGSSIPSHDAWEPTVLKARYRSVLFDGLNRFYVRDEDEDLAGALSSPANVFDDYLSYRCSQWRAAAGELPAVRTALARSSQIDVALEQTRAELAKSQANLRDARSELAATRTALLHGLRDTRP
jgi:FkbM family methyltransferase